MRKDIYIPKLGINIFVIYGVAPSRKIDDDDEDEFISSVWSMNQEDVGIKQLKFD